MHLLSNNPFRRTGLMPCSFNISNQQCTDPAKIAQEFSDLFTSLFKHNDDTVEITSPELEVHNICIKSFSSDMVLD